ncbi:hypothetical protein TI39_contig329g00011 [Zymoseptoria brevis]|uniref:Uncharacterized protein n=1 Tax=Zymoseptoria brevis TaxID=1047168 RepID=A0A0F4GSM3_9PEZI|nr:hypothetical protein TI39_contig329g00011 [Zymoseptoria brevis]
MAESMEIPFGFVLLTFLVAGIAGLIVGANLEQPTPKLKVTAMQESSAPKPTRASPVTTTDAAHPYCRQLLAADAENERLRRQLREARDEATLAQASAREQAYNAVQVEVEQRKESSAWEARVERLKVRAEGSEAKIAHFRMMTKMAETAKEMAEESKERAVNELRLREEKQRQEKKDVEEEVMEAESRVRMEGREELKRALANLAAAQEKVKEVSAENGQLRERVAALEARPAAQVLEATVQEEEEPEPASPDGEGSHEAEAGDEEGATEEPVSSPAEQELVESESESVVADESGDVQAHQSEQPPPLPDSPKAGEPSELSEAPIEALGDQTHDKEEAAASPPPAEEADVVEQVEEVADSLHLPANDSAATVGDAQSNEPTSIERRELSPLNKELVLALEEAARSPPRAAHPEGIEQDIEPATEAPDDEDDPEEVRYSPPEAVEQHVLADEADELEDAPMADEETPLPDPSIEHGEDSQALDLMDVDDATKGDPDDSIMSDSTEDDSQTEEVTGIYEHVEDDRDTINNGASNHGFDVAQADDMVCQSTVPSSPHDSARWIPGIDSPKSCTKLLDLDNDQDMDQIGGQDETEMNDQHMGDAADASDAPDLPDLSRGVQGLSGMTPELYDFLKKSAQTSMQTSMQPYDSPESQDAEMSDDDENMTWENVDVDSLVVSSPPQESYNIDIPSTGRDYHPPAARPMPAISQAPSPWAPSKAPGSFLSSSSAISQAPSPWQTSKAPGSFLTSSSSSAPVAKKHTPMIYTPQVHIVPPPVRTSSKLKPCGTCFGNVVEHDEGCETLKVQIFIAGSGHDPLCKTCSKRQSTHAGMDCPLKTKIPADGFEITGFIALTDCINGDCHAIENDPHLFDCFVAQIEQMTLLGGQHIETGKADEDVERKSEPLKLKNDVTLRMLDQDTGSHKRQKAVHFAEPIEQGPAVVVAPAPKPRSKPKASSIFFTPQKKPALKQPSTANAKASNGRASASK